MTVISGNVSNFAPKNCNSLFDEKSFPGFLRAAYGLLAVGLVSEFKRQRHDGLRRHGRDRLYVGNPQQVSAYNDEGRQ